MRSFRNWQCIVTAVIAAGWCGIAPSAAETISTIAGTGSIGDSGDGGPASAAQLADPDDAYVDASGHVYIADTGNNKIRKIDGVTGIISTIAGTGASGSSGDGGPATAAKLKQPQGVFVDALGNIYIADSANNKIRKIDAGTGNISTLAGTGFAGNSGDGGPATSAMLKSPRDLWVDAAGNIYVADKGNNKVRKIDAASGNIETIAGTGTADDGGDGGPATAARLRAPEGVHVDAAGNIYIADTGNHRIRKVDAASGIINTIAGSGSSGDSGDGGPATAAQLKFPEGMVLDANGHVIIADTGNHKIKKVDVTTGFISTLSGLGGSGGDSGDGGPASAAELKRPRGVAIDTDGNIYIADGANHKIRTITPGVFVDVSILTGFNVQSTTSSDAGSGLHWGDVDNDGDPDAIITGNSSSRLMMNNAGVNFSSIVFGGGSVSRQGSLVDLDNDGDLDFWAVSVANDDVEGNFDNDGSGSFTGPSNLGMVAPSANEGAAAADVNADGRCDIVMFSGTIGGNWIGHQDVKLPLALSAENDVSYGMNDAGDSGDGDFCSSGDVNNDGYLDFFYHFGMGKLFLSDGNGNYAESAGGISVVTGVSKKIGSAWADYDNDGDLDLFVPRYDSGSTGYLWQNNGGVFTNVASSAGITDASGQRSACWGDYDNDGDLDLYVVTRSGLNNVLYQNQGGPGWGFVAKNENTKAPGDGHDAVFVDYDNDGDLDLAVTQQGATNVLLRNTLNNTNYLKVRVVGRGVSGTNRSAAGVRVELWDAAGTTYLARREVSVARGYGGSEPNWVHFGGVTNSSAYTVKVYFTSRSTSDPVTESVVPSGASTTIGSTTVPQMLTVTEPKLGVVKWREVPNSPT